MMLFLFILFQNDCISLMVTGWSMIAHDLLASKKILEDGSRWNVSVVTTSPEPRLVLVRGRNRYSDGRDSSSFEDF